MVVKLAIITLNLSVLVVQRDIFNQLQKIIFNFIWGKHYNVKINIVIGHYKLGGLEVPDIFSREKAQKAS